MDPNDPESLSLTPGGWPTLARIPSYCYPPTSGDSEMTRFQPYGVVEYPEPGPNGLPTTYTGTFNYSQTETQGATAIDTHTSTASSYQTLSYDDSFNLFGFTVGFDYSTTSGTSNSTTWQQQNSSTSTAGTTATASYSITGPQLSDNYNGPATFNVYLDNVYGTYAFYSSLEPQVALGYIAITTNSSLYGYCPGPGAEPSLTFGTEPVTTPTPTASAPQTVYLTNCSPYPLTMVGPAVSFSDPGFAIANDGKDYCSNRVLNPYDSQNGPWYCEIDVDFAPVPSDAPNTLYGTAYPVSATMIAAGTENASSYQNILVTNPATVSATAQVGPAAGATLYPTGTGQPKDPKEPNVVTFSTPNPYALQTQQFTFTNYYSSPVYFTPVGGIALSDGADFTIPDNTNGCYSTGTVVVNSLGSCTFTLDFLPTVGVGTETQQSGELSTKLTAMAIVGSPTGTPIPMAIAGAAGPAALTLAPSPVTFNVTGTYSGQSFNPVGNEVALKLTNNTNYTVNGLTASDSFFGAYLNTNGGNCTGTPPSLAAGSSCTVEAYTTEYTNIHGTFYGNIEVSGTLSNGASVWANINAIANVSLTELQEEQITLTGAEQSKTEQIPATHATGKITVSALEVPAASNGTLSIQVGGFNAAASYAQGATVNEAVKAIAEALNVDGSPVTAKASGSVITLTSVIAGSGGNITFEATGDGNFELIASGATLTGGKDATEKTEYDGGTVDVTTAGVVASADWGSKSTPQSIAKALAESINKVAGAYWTASVSGDVITVTSVSQTPPAIIVTVTDKKGFTPPSFGATLN